VYADWQAALPADIEVCAVQLPGRGARFGERPFRDLPALIEALARALLPSIDRPFALFGHSLGGLIAFELARYLARRFAAQPRHLFVSGCPAPQLRDPPRRVHELADAALIEVLKNYNGTPPEVLSDRELLELVLPTIRADFALSETYHYATGPRLNVPITALAGRGEDYRSPEQVSGWQRETTAAFGCHWFDGDHFFVTAQRDAVLRTLVDELARHEPRLVAAQ
jgi:surfactin synthase thioesterase subunit